MEYSSNIKKEKSGNKKILLYVLMLLLMIIALITYFSTKMEKVDVGENLSKSKI